MQLHEAMFLPFLSSVVIRCAKVRPPWLAKSRAALVPDLVEEVWNHVVFLNSRGVEMLPYGGGKPILALAPKLLLSGHCRRVKPDAARLGEHPLVVWAREGRRRAQSVLATVCVEYDAVERRPL